MSLFKSTVTREKLCSMLRCFRVGLLSSTNAVLFAIFLLGAVTQMSAAANDCGNGEERLSFSLVTALEGHPKGEAAISFANEFNEFFDGEYCLIVFGNSELSDDNKVFEKVIAGDVAFAAPSASKFRVFSNNLTIFDTPFLFDSELHVLNFMGTPEAREMLDDLSSNGFRVLGFWSNGMYQFTSTREIREPNDAKGLTFRVQSPSEIILQLMRVLEAEHRTMGFSELPNAVESGEISAQYNTWSNIFSSKVYRWHKFAVASNHGYLGYPVIVSDKFLNKLSVDQKRELFSIFELVAHERNRFAFEINEMNRDRIEQSGVSIVELNEAEVTAWRDALQPLANQFAESIGADLLEAARRSNELFVPLVD